MAQSRQKTGKKPFFQGKNIRSEQKIRRRTRGGWLITTRRGNGERSTSGPIRWGEDIKKILTRRPWAADEGGKTKKIDRGGKVVLVLLHEKKKKKKERGEKKSKETTI